MVFWKLRTTVEIFSIIFHKTNCQEVYFSWQICWTIYFGIVFGNFIKMLLCNCGFYCCVTIEIWGVGNCEVFWWNFIWIKLKLYLHWNSLFYLIIHNRGLKICKILLNFNFLNRFLSYKPLIQNNYDSFLTVIIVSFV